MEAQNTVQVFSQEDKVMSMCSVDEGSNNMVAMLNDLRAFCTSKEQGNHRHACEYVLHA